MKTGFENRRNLRVMVVLLILMAGALAYCVRSFLPSGGAPPQQSSAMPVTPAQAPHQSGVGRPHEAPKALRLETLDPTLHPELMAAAESLVYTGAGRNIFSLTPPPPKIEKVEGPVRPEPVVATGPPPPPPIDLKFYGYEAVGADKKAFILHGNDVFIAAEGDIVDRHYRILHIDPLSIQVTNLLYNDTQILPLS